MIPLTEIRRLAYAAGRAARSARDSMGEPGAHGPRFPDMQWSCHRRARPGPPPPRLADDVPVAVCGGFADVDLRHRATQTAGKRNPDRKLWGPRSAAVVALSLQAGIVHERASDTGCRR